MKNSFFYYIFFFSIGIFCSTLIFFLYHYHFPLALIPIDKTVSKSILLLDVKGEKIDYLFGSPHDIIYYKELPKNIINAFLAAEDHRFFSHRGVSFYGIIRSIIINSIKKKFVQGGSTITQQVIKLTLGDHQKTLFRKIKEQLLAFFVESEYSKEQIFESYVNIAYFGKGIYGLKDAAVKFFNKKPFELTISEAATLAGILCLPERYCPLNNLKNSINRRDIILKRMHALGFINKKELEEALKEILPLPDLYNMQESIFVKQLVYQFFLSHRDLFAEDKTYIVQTTINIEKQRAFVQKSIKGINNASKKCKSIDGGGIMIDSNSGEIRAIFGGKNSFSLDSLNRAISAKRQIGSVVKPLVIYYAFSKGDSKDTVYNDAKLTEFSNWSPNNYDHLFNGDMTLEKALIQSNNIIPIKILLKHGILDFGMLLKNIGFSESPLNYFSTALGCIDSNPIKVANSIAVIENGGILHEPFCVKKITDITGKIYYLHRQKEVLVLKKEHTKKISELMIASGEYLQKKKNIIFKKRVGMKTGTASKFTSCWSVGFNENSEVVAFYLGDDKGKSLEKNKIRSFLDVFPIVLDLL